jgi:hypothetical protein
MPFSTARKVVFVALDQPPAEVRLRREVVMQAGFGHVQRLGDVGIAEAVEAARLHQALGHIQDALRAVAAF